jgi:ABC-type nickel/cobalt efflux system permease component RcnA
VDESSSSIIPLLFGITFLLAILIAVWQYFRVTKARREHHHSAAELRERKEAQQEQDAHRDRTVPPGSPR